MKTKLMIGLTFLLCLSNLYCIRLNPVNWADEMDLNFTDMFNDLFDENRNRTDRPESRPESRPETPAAEAIKCEKWLCACYNPNVSNNLSCMFNDEEKKCYENAECKLQPSGRCGFTMSMDYRTCLTRARGESPLNVTSPETNLSAPTPTPTPTPSSTLNETPLNTTATSSSTSPTTTTGACRPTGCYNTVCSNRDEPSTCAYKREYDCFKMSTCESSLDSCSWTHNPDFFNCLENARI
jgi:hypothetical protein